MNDDIYPNELAETLSKSIPSFEHIEAVPVEQKKHLPVLNNFPPTYCNVLGCKTNLVMCATRHKNLNNHSLEFFECEECEIGKKSYEMYMIDKEQNALNEERKQFTHRQDEIDKKRAAIIRFAQKLKAGKKKDSKTTTNTNTNTNSNTNKAKRKSPKNKVETEATTDVSETRKKKLEKIGQKHPGKKDIKLSSKK